MRFVGSFLVGLFGISTSGWGIGLGTGFALSLLWACHYRFYGCFGFRVCFLLLGRG